LIEPDEEAAELFFFFNIFPLGLTCTASESQDSLGILFIGNSYFWMNDMPSVLRNLAIHDGKKVFVDSS